MPQLTVLDSVDFAQAELNTHIQQQVNEVAPEIEIDSESDCFGLIYRVWFGMKHLGNFYHSPAGETWVSIPFCNRNKKHHNNPEDAQQAIINAWKLN